MNMFKSMMLFMTILSQQVSAHVCDSIRTLKGFESDKLFHNTIINGKPIDYFVFRSSCDFHCVFGYFNRLNIQYNLQGNNIAVYDKISIATITVESSANNVISGYLTCSSNDIRHYIDLPFSINRQNVILDFQTEDYGVVSRSLTFSKQTYSQYINLQRQLSIISYKQQKDIGFYTYYINSKNQHSKIKLGDFSREGFMLIMEMSR